MRSTRTLGEWDSSFVLTGTRSVESNWRTTFGKIVTWAGLKLWDKLFQNLRGSRETELAKSFPVHVAAAWIANSVPIAAKHYLQVTTSTTSVIQARCKKHCSGSPPRRKTTVRK